MLLLAFLACFEDEPIVAAGPTLSFLEMPCEYSDTAKADSTKYLLPAGAVVVSAEQCSNDDDEGEVCSSIGWTRAGSGFIIASCWEGYSVGSTSVVNYLE